MKPLASSAKALTAAQLIAKRRSLYLRAFLVWLLFSFGGLLSIPEQWLSLYSNVVGFGFFLVLVTGGRTRYLGALALGSLFFAFCLWKTLDEQLIRPVANSAGYIGIVVAVVFVSLWSRKKKGFDRNAEEKSLPEIISVFQTDMQLAFERAKSMASEKIDGKSCVKGRNGKDIPEVVTSKQNSSCSSSSIILGEDAASKIIEKPLTISAPALPLAIPAHIQSRITDLERTVNDLQRALLTSKNTIDSLRNTLLRETAARQKADADVASSKIDAQSISGELAACRKDYSKLLNEKTVLEATDRNQQKRLKKYNREHTALQHLYNSLVEKFDILKREHAATAIHEEGQQLEAIRNPLSPTRNKASQQLEANQYPLSPKSAHHAQPNANRLGCKASSGKDAGHLSGILIGTEQRREVHETSDENIFRTTKPNHNFSTSVINNAAHLPFPEQENSRSHPVFDFGAQDIIQQFSQPISAMFSVSRNLSPESTSPKTSLSVEPPRISLHTASDPASPTGCLNDWPFSLRHQPTQRHSEIVYPFKRIVHDISP